MFRSRDPRAGAAVAAALAGGLTGVLLATGSGWAQPPPPEDAVGAVQELVFFVESLDGTESVERDASQVTVTLTSDVLFEFDQATLTGSARDRLAAVAHQIRADRAGGVIAIDGHTDDQGTESYNQDLSGRRAEAVRAELASLLADVDVRFRSAGHGESRPRVPNIVDGEPNEANRAENRRVEIGYDVPR